MTNSKLKSSKYVLVKSYPGTRLSEGTIVVFKEKHEKGFDFIDENTNTYVRSKHVADTRHWRAV